MINAFGITGLPDSPINGDHAPVFTAGDWGCGDYAA